MNQKVKNISTEEQLLQARERGLQEAAEIHSMSAHGKVFGMDAFSWINPQMDTLSTVITSFPFAAYWIASHDQVKSCLENYPEMADNLESLILYDRTLLNVNRNILDNIPNIVCIEGISEALEIQKAMSHQKGVLLFTTGNINGVEQKEQFEQFVALNR
ncbi:MAG: hypothetical protein QNK23_15820 [Crocinitomicaceae bacterium]|nr:hypothetical protein [Crocinitomicaceae bacterium]